MSEQAAMAESGSTQMNMRINRALKKGGDEVFAQLGWTASEAVRRLYELAVARRGEPKRVAEALLVESSDAVKDTEALRAAKHAAVERGVSLFGGIVGLACGLDSSAHLDVSTDELREWALWEEYGWEASQDASA